MAETSVPASVYELDAADCISFVSESWLDFARGNGAPELTRERVLGHPLWAFVAGDETRRVYEAIFERVRRMERPVVVPFRCDSPDRFRFMELAIQPSAAGRMECRATLVREQTRPFFSILDRAFPRSERSLPMCSFCRRILVAGAEWLEAEAAVARLDLFDSTRLPRLEYRVCDGCAAVARPGGDDERLAG